MATPTLDSASYDDLYSPIEKTDGDSMSQIDPIGSSIFGWGNASHNAAIQDRVNKINQVRAANGQKVFKNAQEAIDANAISWDDLNSDILGADRNKQQNFYSGVEGQDAGALSDLKSALGDYKSVSGLYDDPSMYGDVGDVSNAAVPDAATVASQKDALQQFKNRSTPQETAEEQLIRLTAQRKQEANERGDREATAQNLKSRGVYGSGAEVMSALMSQGANADQRAMANTAANAQASQRAQAALGSYSDLAAKMRASETGEGSLANQVNMFNNQVNQVTNNARSAGLQAATTADNTSKGNRAVAIDNASQGVSNAKRSDNNSLNQTLMGVTQGTTGSRTAGADQFTQAANAVDQTNKDAEADLKSQYHSSLLGGGAGGIG